MNMQDTYLDEVSRRLDGLSRAQRDLVLDDLREHLVDAADAGRSWDETVAALGSPDEIAARAHEEFGTTPGAPDAADRAWRVLQWTAVAVGLVIAVLAAFILPSQSTAVSNGMDAETVITQTLVEALGLGVALLCLVPSLMMAVPLVLPARMRAMSAVVAASVLTLFCLVTAFGTGGLFLPVAMIGWAAVITRWRMRHGGYGRAWWIAGAVAIALPGVLLTASALSGTMGVSILAWVLVAADIVIAVLVALGRWRAGWFGAGFGALILLGGMMSAGFLILGTTWLGGLLVAVGLAHALGARRG